MKVIVRSAINPLRLLQDDDKLVEVYWVIMEKLIIAHQASSATQIGFHGHHISVLRHYNPFPDAPHQSDPAFTAVNLETCCLESAIVVLLSWACSFACALQNGYEIEGRSVVFTIGGSSLCSLIKGMIEILDC